MVERADTERSDPVVHAGQGEGGGPGRESAADPGALGSPGRDTDVLQAVGTLAGGIAHDFNNLLTPILWYLDVSLEELPETHPVAGHLRHVTDAAQRAKALVEQVLTFSRQLGGVRRTVDFARLTEEYVAALTPLIATGIELRVEVDPRPCPVFANPAELRQVLNHLVSNAIHALGERGGRIEVSLARLGGLDRGSGPAPTGPDERTEEGVRLVVTDNGRGMDAATRERVFDPFYSTKRVNEGRGLGLSVVHGIVTSHGGSVGVESEPERGTRLRVDLPCSGVEAPDPVSSALSAARRRGTRVLLVDDEEPTCLSAAAMLEEWGCRVESHTSPLAALARFEQSPENYDLLVTDQIMPEITGVGLTRRVLARRPDLPVILITGFADSLPDGEVAGLGVRECVKKPIATRDFGRAVARVLDGAETSED